MLKRFKLIVTFLIGFTSIMSLCAQDNDVTFKDVLLDGKPAKLNTTTGEIRIITPIDKIVETKVDSVVIKSTLVNKPKISDAIEVSEDSLALKSDFHMVKEGDNLYQLALKYKTSLSALQEANNLDTTLIQKGQQLRVRNFNSVNTNPLTWVVKKGDNLYRIAIENGTTVKALKHINDLKSDVIKVGQTLKLK